MLLLVEELGEILAVDLTNASKLACIVLIVVSQTISHVQLLRILVLLVSSSSRTSVLLTLSTGLGVDSEFKACITGLIFG